MGIIEFFKKLFGTEDPPVFKLRKKSYEYSERELFKKKPLKAIKPAKKIPPKKKEPIRAIKKQPEPKPIVKKTEAPKEKEIGVITHYFDRISVAVIKLKAPIKVGDKIHIKGAHDDFTQSVQSIQINHNDVQSAAKGDDIGIKVAKPVHVNDKVLLWGHPLWVP